MSKFLSEISKYDVITDKNIALIIDGFINGLGIARSLRNIDGITTVILCKKGAALGYSNCVDHVINYASIEELKGIFRHLNTKVKKAIPYYCNDTNLSLLMEMKEQLTNFSIYPLDLNLLNKDTQLEVCEATQIQYPKSYFIASQEENDNLQLKKAKYIVKPLSTKKTNPFKTKITSQTELIHKYCKMCLDTGVSALVSEYIEGDDSHLLTLGGYCHEGVLLMPFTGRKISQRPKNNGVASMAESIEDNQLITIGSKFLKQIEYTGIFQIEFKIDRDHQYYFIEFNPRNWSWSYVATISGKNLSLKKYAVETNQNIVIPSKGKSNFYLWTEGVIYNMVFDKWFSIIFKLIKLVFSSRVTFAIFNYKDPMPFIYYLKNCLMFTLRLRKELR